MRMIDADALKTEIKMDIEDDGLQEKMVFYRINEAPSIDIVRCAECRYWNTSGCRDGVGECEWAYYMTKPDDFCNYGKREGE